MNDARFNALTSSICIRPVMLLWCDCQSSVLNEDYTTVTTIE